MGKTIVGPDRKIDPDRRVQVKPDGTPANNDRFETGPTDLAFAEWQAAGLEMPNLPALR